MKKSLFTKDIQFLPDHVVKDPLRVQKLCSTIAHDPMGYLHVTMCLLHQLEGSQMWVSREVSDDLLASTIEDINFREVAWPHHRLELVFEDPKIPSFLVAVYTNREYTEAVERAMKLPAGRLHSGKVDPDKMDLRLIHIQADTHDNAQASVTYTPEDVDRFATGENIRTQKVDYEFSTGLSETERDAFRELAVQLFKVLLFCESEGCEPRKTKEPPTRKQGGKPGFKNRPKTDRWIVEYLPRNRAEKKKQTEETKKTHAFNGRHGHWRRFKSEYFVNLRGKRKFIYPVPGPNGTFPKRKFVVSNR